MAGFPDMQELSPLGAESAKQIAPGTLAFTGRRQTLRLVLGFGAWHFQLSEGPILEEISYA
jgi:hypothetical protein